MAVTLDNIKFYDPRPRSLPARPPKSTSPNHHTSFPHRIFKRTGSTSSTLSTVSFSLSSEPALSHPLPPRPPTIIPSTHHTESTRLKFSTSTSHTAQCNPECENDFDRALSDFFATNNGKNEDDRESLICVPKEDNKNDVHGMVTSPDLEVVNHMTASFLSPSSTVQEPLESLADAPRNPITRNESHPWDEVNEIASATPTDLSSAFCTSKPPTSASNELNTDSTGVTTQDSAQDSSAANQEYLDTPHTSGILSHSSKSDGSTVRRESTELQGASGDSKRASSNQSGESSKRKKTPPACLSYPPPPLVVVSVPSRPVSLRRKSPRLSSNHLHNSERITRGSYISNSAPSDDENDADYLDSSEIGEAGKSLRPSKRRRKSLDKASSASWGVSKQSTPESSRAKSLYSQPEDFIAESEPIPVQGFLRLRSSGPEVIYCVEFSQTHLLSSVANGQIEPAQPPQQTARPAAKIPYVPEEDAYIMELKSQELGWDKIEALFAQRYPYRKKSCLAAHYCNKLKPSLKRNRKRRAKSRV